MKKCVTTQEVIKNRVNEKDIRAKVGVASTRAKKG